MRVICLLPNIDGGWLVRVQNATGSTVFSSQSFRKLERAEEAFAEEGDHQPFAAMVVHVLGRRHVTVRSGRNPLAITTDEQLEAREKRVEKTRIAARAAA